MLSRILVAPDKFKGTLSARRVAAAIAAGLRDAGAGLEPAELPIADGGDGTAEVLAGPGAREVLASVSDPLGRPIEATAALIDPETAVVEVASASGLWRLGDSEREAERASSRGTGELIAAAIAAGARTVLLAAGGSATTDGGRGALEALGAELGSAPARLEPLRAALRGVRLVVLCDVDVPLLGRSGSARMFGPQKGADPAAVERLERRLEAWGELAAELTGRDPRRLPMAGAGGGLAGGFWAFAGAELVPGAPWVLDALGFDVALAGCAAVITGEGAIDAQTARGKAVGEVARRAAAAMRPCHAIVGVDRRPARERAAGALRVYEAAAGAPAGPADVRARAAALGARLGSA